MAGIPWASDSPEAGTAPRIDARVLLPNPEHGQHEINRTSDIGQQWWNGWHSGVRRAEDGFNSNRCEVHPIGDPTVKSSVERCALLIPGDQQRPSCGWFADRRVVAGGVSPVACLA